MEQSSTTVELAALALGVTGAEIAKSIPLYNNDGAVILLVASGHRKVDGRKLRDYFGLKAKMLAFEDLELLVGHPVGGVCPFGMNSRVKIYLDDSLKQFNFVHAACGSGNSALKLSIAELEEFSEFEKWVDITKE